MKIIVGVSESEAVRMLSSVLAPLKIQSAKFDLVHIVERLGQVGVYPKEDPQKDLVARYLRMQEEEGEKALREAKQNFHESGLEVQTTLLTGFAANTLIEHADKTGGRLIAIGSSGKGPIEGMVIGSVGRKTAIHAPCSVLIAKATVARKDGLKVVFATDLSGYAGRCIDAFLGYRMKGISEIVLTTVIPKRAGAYSEEADRDAGRSIRSELASCLKGLGARLEPTKATVRPRIEVGPVGDALERVMREEQADLLIVGAQGHGFLHRISIGSVSLEQAVRKPYSVLIIRA